MRTATDSPRDFAAFRAEVERSAVLTAHLQAETDPELFIALTVQAGALTGYHFTPDDVRAAMTAGRRAWTGRLRV